MADVRVVACPACGAKNRVNIAKTAGGNDPICGRCKARLSLADKPIIVTDATFSSEVEHSSIPVVVDMWAPWCGPCRAIAPVLEQLAGEMTGRVRIAKLNVDENQVTAGRFNVRSIPTLLVFKGGREVDRLVGVMPKAELKQRLERVLAPGASAS
jgi:thioredoxin 2